MVISKSWGTWPVVVPKLLTWQVALETPQFYWKYVKDELKICRDNPSSDLFWLNEMKVTREGGWYLLSFIGTRWMRVVWGWKSGYRFLGVGSRCPSGLIIILNCYYIETFSLFVDLFFFFYIIFKGRLFREWSNLYKFLLGYRVFIDYNGNRLQHRINSDQNTE